MVVRQPAGKAVAETRWAWGDRGPQGRIWSEPVPPQCLMQGRTMPRSASWRQWGQPSGVQPTELQSPPVPPISSCPPTTGHTTQTQHPVHTSVPWSACRDSLGAAGPERSWEQDRVETGSSLKPHREHWLLSAPQTHQSSHSRSNVPDLPVRPSSYRSSVGYWGPLPGCA